MKPSAPCVENSGPASTQPQPRPSFNHLLSQSLVGLQLDTPTTSLSAAHVLAYLMTNGTPAKKASLRLYQAPGAGAWLLVEASASVFNCDPCISRTPLRQRLHLSFREVEILCPLCGRAFDCFGDHAAVCPLRGRPHSPSPRHCSRVLRSSLNWVDASERRGRTPSAPARLGWPPSTADVYIRDGTGA